MTECMVCGNPLTAATKRKRYCSRGCQQASYRHRKSPPTQGACDDTPGLQTPSTGLSSYAYPERALDTLHGSNPDGSTPGALQGDDYPLTYDADGDVELPACLDRRKPKLAEVA
jgi:hypothetical protein